MEGVNDWTATRVSAGDGIEHQYEVTTMHQKYAILGVPPADQGVFNEEEASTSMGGVFA